MGKRETNSDNEVVVLSQNLLVSLSTQICEMQKEIEYLAGEYPNEDTLAVMGAGQKLLTKLKTETVITPNPWEALATAEIALADWETAKRKGYVANAKRQVFSVMDAKRALKPQS